MRKIKLASKHAKAVMVFFSFFVIIGGVCLANSFTGITGTATADELNDDLLVTYKQTFNEKANGLPDIVFRSFDEEVVNIYLSDIGITLYAVLHNGELIELNYGEQESPTFTITTTYETVVKLQFRDISLSDAIDEGLVSFSSDGFIKKTALSTVLFSIDIYDIFT